MPPVSNAEIGVEDGTAALTRADCLCPVCLEIFLEPVTLPCNHTFCKTCFLETVDKASMTCPMCRKRVSSWARLHGRNKTLVNVELWRRVQEAFPALCQRRLSGQDEGDSCALTCKPKVCQPGELRKEYEDQISKLAEEKRVRQEAEKTASEEFIQRLLAEEEEREAEERRRQEEVQLEEDEKLARLLSHELNSVNSNTSNTKPKMSGEIVRFLSPVIQIFPSSSTDNHDTSLLRTRQEEAPEMPEIDFYGKVELESECESVTRISQTAEDASCKRKSVELREGGGASKRPCTASTSVLVELEKELQRRQQQEEEDRQMALRMQRELDGEVIKHVVDRRKGSADQYPLRERLSPDQTVNNSKPRRSAPAASGSEKQPARGRSSSVERLKKPQASRFSDPKSKTKSPSSTSSTSTPATGSQTASVRKTSKQTTITQMFPSMRN